jgi:hypothetical protein
VVLWTRASLYRAGIHATCTGAPTCRSRRAASAAARVRSVGVTSNCDRQSMTPILWFGQPWVNRWGKEMEVILLLIFQAALPKIRDLLAEESV